jgi:hypothetical protein
VGVESPEPARGVSRRRMVAIALAVALVAAGAAGSVALIRSRRHVVSATSPPPSPQPSVSPEPVACTDGWHVERMPVVDGDSEDALVNVSAIATDDIWAVGVRYVTQTNDEPTQALFEHWDGRHWSIVPGADVGEDGARLSAIAMDSPTDGWAVGNYPATTNPSKGPLVEHWAGSRWSVVPAPPPARGETSSAPMGLVAVEAFAPTDVWVLGRYASIQAGRSVSRDVFEHWDGQSWTDVPWPFVATRVAPANALNVASSAIEGISGRDSTDIWAAGGVIIGSGEQGAANGALVVHWDGRSWLPAVAPIGKAPLTNVAGVSRTDVWGLRGGDFDVAFGGYGGFSAPEILHWDGRSWTVRFRLPYRTDGAKLDSIVAIDRHDAWAVGTDSGQPLIEHWDGKRWSVPPSANGAFPSISEFAWAPSVVTTKGGDVIVFSNEPLPAMPQNRLWFRCAGGA